MLPLRTVLTEDGNIPEGRRPAVGGCSALDTRGAVAVLFIGEPELPEAAD